MSDELRRMLQQQDEMQRLAQPLGDNLRGLDTIADTFRKLQIGQSTIEMLRRDDERRKLLSGLVGGGFAGSTLASIEEQRKRLEKPVEEARRLGLFDTGSSLSRSIDTVLAAQRAQGQLFRLPRLDEIAGMARAALTADAALLAAVGSQKSLAQSMKAMRSPWLRIEEDRASVIAFAEMMGIGRGLDRRAAFDADFASELRSGLGDWRDPVAAEPALLVDPTIRTGLYVDRGFDLGLTDFTPDAFDETLRAAGLRGGEPAEDGGEEEGEQAFVRARHAFARLNRLEVALRRFIDAALSETFGPDWMNSQLPTGMLEAWTLKRDKAVSAGQAEHGLIDYADFSDYKPIIERKDNWAKVFRHVFGRAEDIRESFQRLFPVRIATMHARIITQEDELLMLVETRRVMKAIGAA